MSRNKAANCRNEVKFYITREGMTMTEVVELLADEYGWSRSVSNLSGKLKRGSLRYIEAVELVNVMGYDLVWVKYREVRLRSQEQLTDISAYPPKIKTRTVSVSPCATLASLTTPSF